MQAVSEQLRDISKNSKDLDKKLSNFLSTQLNVQSDILKLTNELTKNGLIDTKTKTIQSSANVLIERNEINNRDLEAISNIDVPARLLKQYGEDIQRNILIIQKIR